MDSKQVIARFEAERQALAMMDHPCIARVLDAGETDLGRPYFVMELVRGEPIVDYCDRTRLSTRERLDLFVRACHGVQHAHQKGVIHRDLKPNNVLVTEVDGKPVPKIIDFGIAKAIGGRLTLATTVAGRVQNGGPIPFFPFDSYLPDWPQGRALFRPTKLPLLSSASLRISAAKRTACCGIPPWA